MGVEVPTADPPPLLDANEPQDISCLLREIGGGERFEGRMVGGERLALGVSTLCTFSPGKLSEERATENGRDRQHTVTRINPLLAHSVV